MTNHNKLLQLERQITAPEHVQFDDGEVALMFATAGDVFEVGPQSIFKYARSIHLKDGDIALVKTTSGRQYGIGNGAIVDIDANDGWLLPTDMPSIEIGQPWEIPGIVITSEVEAVLFRYKIHPSKPYNEQINRPNPFPELSRQLQSVSDQLSK